MHWNKTFTGIFLIFSIANVVLAAPALIRHRHFVTERANDEPTGESKQDSGGLSHEEVEPATSLSSVGLPKWSEMSPTLAEMWSDGSLLDYLAKSPSNADSERTVTNSPSGSHQGSPDADSERTASSSPSGSPQGSTDADSERTASSSPSGSHQGSPDADPERTASDSPSGSHQGSPETWWLQDHLPPLGTWGEGYSASHGQMWPPASVAQPLHDDAHESIESNSFTDMDEASMMFWSSEASGWKEEEAKIAEDVHPHL